MLVLSVALFLLAGCGSSTTGLAPGPEDCELANAVSLAAGQTVEFEGATARTICLAATSAGEEFVLITTSLAENGTTTLTVQGENTTLATGPPSPSPRRTRPTQAAPWQSSLLNSNSPFQSGDLHATLRELERRELSSRMIPSARSSGRSSPSSRSSFPDLGDFMTLNTQSESACDNPVVVTGRVEAVSAHAIVVADIGNPPGGFGSADFASFAGAFDTLVVPIAEEHFGTASDIDENGRVILFFTKEVNALESEGDDTLASGFFFSRDLFPVESQGSPLASCEASNEAELLYLLVPDSAGGVGDPIDREEVERSTIGTIGHEYQHLVNASRRLLGVGGPRPFEDAWLNEAMSHVTEELLFYRVAGLSPGLDLGIDDLGPSQIGVLNDFQRPNLLRLLEFLKSPGSNSPFDAEVELATRGAAWSFLRYSADRLGGSNAAFFSQLIDSSTTGVENLSAALGGTATFFDWLGDWSVGLYADNRVSGLSSRFADRSWDHFSFFDSGGLSSPYVMTSSLASNPVVSRVLTGGGSGYFRFGVAEGQVGGVGLTSGGGAPPSSLRATILRTK